MPNVDLGPLGNTIAGALGGAGGGQLLSMLIPMLAGGSGGLDIGTIIGQLVGGGASGADVTGPGRAEPCPGGTGRAGSTRPCGRAGTSSSSSGGG